MTKFNTGFNMDNDVVSRETALFFNPAEGMTKQSFKEECDINTLVQRFGLTGQLPENVRAPVYGDFTEVVDYQSALNAVIAADASFMELPASVRSRFANNPALFVDFCSDPANREEAIKLGLVVPPPVKAPPEPVLVRMVAEPPVAQ